MDYTAARRNMVDCQILPNQVDDKRIIDALLEIPRERFVPDLLSGIAYVDENVPIGNGRCVMEAMVIARMLQMASLRPEDMALTIGCGTGYAVSILAKIVDTVVAVEPDKVLVQKATENFAALGLNNIAVIEGELSEGNLEQGPYDFIFFDGAVSSVPVTISDQLTENGRLAAIVTDNRFSKACLYTRYGEFLAMREVFDAGTPLLPDFEKEEVFVF